MSKKVSIHRLKQEVVLYDEFTIIPLNLSNGEKFEIKVFPLFKPEKIRDCIKEMAEFHEQAKEDGIIIPENEQDDLVCFYIIKHFTDLKYTTSKKSEKIYEEFKVLINTEVFQIIMGAFLPESISKVHEKIYELSNVHDELDVIFQEEKAKFDARNVQNSDVIFKAVK